MKVLFACMYTMIVTPLMLTYAIGGDYVVIGMSNVILWTLIYESYT